MILTGHARNKRDRRADEIRPRQIELHDVWANAPHESAELEACDSRMHWLSQQGAMTAGMFSRGEDLDAGSLQLGRAAPALRHAKNRDVDPALSEQRQKADEMAFGAARSQRLGHHEEAHGGEPILTNEIPA